MRLVTGTIAGLVMLLASASAFAQLRLVPVRGSSEIKLVAGHNSRTFDLDKELAGSNGSMPGDPPNIYRTLFTAKKGGFLYLVVNVRSHSPISDKNAPCGGDSPQALLWIKVDDRLAASTFQSEIYASCSYNYYDSKVKLTKNRVVISFRSPETKNVPLAAVKIITYDNSRPEDGLKVSTVGKQ